MPLFGSSKNNNTTMNNDSLGATNRGTGTGTGYGNHDLNAGRTGMGTGNPGAGPGVAGPGMAGQGYNDDPNFNNNHPGNNFVSGNRGNVAHRQMAPGDMNTGGAGIPPTGALNNPNQSRSGAGSSTTGKVEQALGSMIGSNSLKAKGLQKQQEADSLKYQSTEIQEAERLEQEALTRRQRAVGHGAHPNNRHLGGHQSAGNQAVGNQAVGNQGGFGPNKGIDANYLTRNQ